MATDPRSIVDALTAPPVGRKIAQLVASGYALATIGAHWTPGGAATGYELIANLARGIGLHGIASWITQTAVPTFLSWPHSAIYLAIAFLFALTSMLLGQAFRRSIYNLTPQPAFGALLLLTIAYDTGLWAISTIGFYLVIGALIGFLYGRDWSERAAFAALTALAPILAIAMVPAIVFSWFTGEPVTPATPVRVESIEGPLRVQVEEPGSRRYS